MIPTIDNQVDVEVVCTGSVDGLTPVLALVVEGEAGDEQVGLTAGRVEEDHASVTCVLVLSCVVASDLTLPSARGDLPDHVEQLAPRHVGAGQVNAGSLDPHHRLISALWIK